MRYVLGKNISFDVPAVSNPTKLLEFLRTEIVPIFRTLRDIANEKSSHYTANSTAMYSWDLNRIGSLFINQSAGPTLVVSPDSAVVLEKLRVGREWQMKVYNTTSSTLTVSMSSDFTATGSWTIPAGQISCWTFYRLDDDAGLARVIELD